MIDQRISYRYGGDTMGGPNDKSKGPSGKGGGADFSKGPDRSKVSAQQTANTKAAISSARASRDDVRERYAVNNPVTVGQVLSPDFTKVGPGSTMDDNRILASNLANRPFGGVNTPFAAANILGNLIGNFAYPINKDFFQENVAGKKDYGYGYDDFAQYMQDRGLDKVDAYGNPVVRELGGDNPLQNLILQQELFPTQFGPVVPMEQEPEGVAALYQQYLKNLGYL
jgi:hypothetical protein